MKTIKFVLTCAAVLVLITAVNVRAADPAGPIMAVLSGATAVELPAKAAQLVSQADAKNLKPTTVAVVKAAVGLNPAAAAAIVGSIAQKTPEMAATAAATAVSLVPNQAVAIARAAAAAAPAQAGRIVESVCRVLPAAYQKVANAVAEVAPGAGKEILTAISAAIPALKAPIAQALAASKGNVPSVSAVLEQVAAAVPTATLPTLAQSGLPSPMVAGPPHPGNPYVPIPVVHNNIDPGSGGDVPTGGRDYAAP
ncbi:MAG TPA: hypothetical protein VNN22_09545 [Verrucomicrobiae bacterium]|nr:hypothetical protein [Verrucomicrobiae bacterium]